MSVQATTHVWEYATEVTGNDLLVLLAIADAANREGENSCQSVTTLARMARCSDRTVQRCLAVLKEAGHIEVTGFNGRYRTNIYRVVMTLTPDSGDRCQVVTPDTGDVRPLTPVSPNPKVLTPVSSDSSLRGADTEGPKRVARPVAAFTDNPHPMPSAWYPSNATIAYLRYRAAGSSVTVENSYDRFVAFHREAGQRKRSWDEAFIAWVSDDLVRARRESKQDDSVHDDLGQRRGVDPEVRARTEEAIRQRDARRASLAAKQEDEQ